MMSDKQSQYTSAIHTVYPDFAIESAEYREGGQYNDILIVNGEWIFRFPRYEEAVQALERSTAIAQGLQGHVPLAVPNPIYTNLDTREIGKVFAGYKMIPGEAVNIYGLEKRYDGATCQRLADQLAEFLKALHGVTAEQIGYELPREDHHRVYGDMYARVREKLFPRMRPDARSMIEKDFETYLSDARNFDYPGGLVHGDFGTGNILFDAEKRCFTGVIDFDFSEWGDPADDLSAIYGFRGRGADFARRLFVRYPELEAGMPRALFYTTTFLLQEALFGAENNEPELIQSGLEPYV